MSVGCGKYPAEKIGDFSVQLFGRHHLNVKKLMHEFGNIIKLLAAAVCVVCVMCVVCVSVMRVVYVCCVQASLYELKMFIVLVCVCIIIVASASI